MILLDTGMRKMPDKCSVCRFFRVESQMYCTAVDTTVSKPRKRRPAWCPLHEVTDSDTISRQAAYETLTEYYHHTTEIQHKALREALERVPSAQPEIIHCKDCKWKQGSECVRFAEVRPFPDDYCSRAERRTDE